MEDSIIEILDRYKFSALETWISSDVISEEDFEKIASEISNLIYEN